MKEYQLAHLLYRAEINIICCEKISKFYEENYWFEEIIIDWKYLGTRRKKEIPTSFKFFIFSWNNAFFEAVSIIHSLLSDSKRNPQISFFLHPKFESFKEKFESAKEKFKKWNFVTIRDQVWDHKDIKCNSRLEDHSVTPIILSIIKELNEVINILFECDIWWIRENPDYDIIDSLNMHLERCIKL